MQNENNEKKFVKEALSTYPFLGKEQVCIQLAIVY